MHTESQEIMPKSTSKSEEKKQSLKKKIHTFLFFIGLRIKLNNHPSIRISSDSKQTGGWMAGWSTSSVRPVRLQCNFPQKNNSNNKMHRQHQHHQLAPPTRTTNPHHHHHYHHLLLDDQTKEALPPAVLCAHAFAIMPMR